MRPYHTICFADDKTLVLSETSYQSLLDFSQEIEATTFKWFTINKLKLNSDKFEELVLSTRRPLPGYGSVKILGFTLDNKLNWLCHISLLKSNLSSISFLLRRLKILVDM